MQKVKNLDKSMQIKEKVLKIILKALNYRIDVFDCSDKIDKLYKKEMEKEIKGMKKHPLLFKGEYKEVGTFGDTLDTEGFEADINYNQALQDILDLLSYKKDK